MLALSILMPGIASAQSGAAVVALPTAVDTDPSAWTLDRSAPAEFEKVTWQGRQNVLHLGVEPPSTGTSFRDWQGYHQKLDMPAGAGSIRGDLWLDTGWMESGSSTDYVRTGIWGSVQPDGLPGYVDAQAVFPIISFTNQDGVGRLEVWDTTVNPSGGWVDLGVSSADALNFGSWNRLEMRVLPDADTIEYLVNGVSVYTWQMPRGDQDNIADDLWAVYLKPRNNGVTAFDTYWSDLVKSELILDGESITAAPNGIEVIAGGVGTVSVADGVIVQGGITTGQNSDATIEFGSGSGVLTTGNGAIGIVSAEGSVLTVSGGSVSTLGNNAAGLQANGAGSGIVAQDMTIDVLGRAHGAVASEGGSVTLTGGEITTVAGYSYGLLAEDSGSTITSSADVTTSGEWAFGAYARDDASITLTGGNVETGGLRAHGLLADQGGTVTSGANVTTRGDRAHGAVAGTSSGSGDIVLTGGTVRTTGSMSYGLQAYGNSSITGTADVVTEGASSFGVSADGDGNIALTGGSVTTSGDFSIGVRAVYDDRAAAAGVLEAEDLAIATSGNGAVGAFAGQGGSVSLNGGSVSTTGSAAHGLAAQNADSKIDVTGTEITVSGAGAVGAGVLDGGAITLSGGSVTAGKAALHAEGGEIHATDVALKNTVSAGNTSETGAAYAANGGFVGISGGSIEASGGRQSGLFASSQGAIGATGVEITVSGDRGRGVYAAAGSNGAGIVSITGGSIVTDGLLSHGLFAKKTSGSTGDYIATISAIDVSITVDGTDANGVYAGVGGSIAVTGGTVSTAGERGVGLHAQAADDGMIGGGSIEATDVSITTTGANAIGIFAEKGGAVSLNGGSVTTSGAGAHALVAADSGEAGLSLIDINDVDIQAGGEGAAAAAIVASGQINITDSSLDAAGAALAVFSHEGSLAEFSVAGSSVESGSGMLLAVDRSNDTAGTGITRLVLSNDTEAKGNVADLGVRTSGYTDLTVDSSRLEGAVHGVRNLDLSNGATWVATGASGIQQVNIGTGGATLNAASNLVLDGELTGAGDLTKDGTGRLTLSGDGQDYTGVMSIDDGSVLLTGSLAGTVIISTGGTFQVGDGQVSGDLLADTVNGGTLIFHQVGDYDYTGALSGDGGLVKRGSGTLTLSGEYRYTGSTTIEGGLIKVASQLDSETTLNLDNGTLDLGDTQQEVSGLAGSSGTLAIGQSGSLTVNQSTNSVFSGNISGNGSFVKTGSGSLNLTGISDFTGEVGVNDGRLAVNGVLPGTIIVGQGAVLGGSGTVGQIQAGGGATVAPGNSIGTLHVTGDVNFAAGSVYEVEVDADGNSDKIIASGTAHIDGANVSVLAAAGNYRWTNDYVIISAAGGIDGRFADADVDLPFLNVDLAYEATDVILTLSRNDRSFATAAVTGNQSSVAAALDQSSQTDDLYRAVAAQTDEANARAAFDALSGEIWATASTFVVDQSRLAGEQVMGRLQQADALSAALASGGAATSSSGGTAIWGQVTGSWNKVKATANAMRATQDQVGFVTGVDTVVGDWRIGAAIGHAERDIDVNAIGSTAEVSSTNVSIYAGGGWNALRVRAGAAYGWNDIDGDRTVEFEGFLENITGAADAKSVSAFGEISYVADLGTYRVEPFAGINHVHVRTGAFEETGGGAALQLAKATRDVTFSTLGLRLGTDIPVSASASISPRLSVGWQHAFGDVEGWSDNTMSTGESFRVAGQSVAKDTALIEAGLHANIAPGASIGASYVGNVSSRWKDHGVRVGLSYSF
ncbi:MAG TPA: autotransporter domain-containing protein [Croceibacterium sp.]|nr:autotransporter domain-containing protein [Croceibacterium sp.]